MKKLLFVTLTTVLFYACSSDDADTSALDAQIASLQTRVDNLTAQVTSAGAEATELSSKVQNLENQLAEAVQNYNNAQIEIEDLEADLEFYETQLNEILFTINYWFGITNGDYEFDIFQNGEFLTSRAWEIGLSEDDELVFNSYYWTVDGCYEYIPAISLGPDSESYISNASFDDFGVASYNVDGSLVGVTGNVNLFQTFTYINGTGLSALISAYQGTDLVYQLQTVGYIQKSDIPSSEFCD